MILSKCAIAAAIGLGTLGTVGIATVDDRTHAPDHAPVPAPAPAPGHCQIPCGIYGDDTRFAILAEHITTIEKSMKQIAELQQAPGENANQLVRWVNNKETHADEYAAILAEYFLQQRIKTAEADSAPDAYAAKLANIHAMMVLAMKCKQTIDTAHTDALAEKLHAFAHLYKGEE